MAEFIGTFKRKNVTKSLVWMFAIVGVLVIVRTVASPDTGPWTPDARLLIYLKFTKVPILPR